MKEADPEGVPWCTELSQFSNIQLKIVLPETSKI